ncbi:MAG: aspartate aminotransferase family protein [Candidatus Obscuribacterales bacterium]|nr:aspartate aminotransferase family protein [Candidatus Obscuribacterales bacterium]
MSAFFPRNFRKRYPVIKSAKGVWITDTDEKTYLDGCSGAVVANLGFGVKEISDAITKQVEQAPFAHTSQFLSEAALRLADRIIELAPAPFQNGGRVYFASGGSEAVETALKMARGFFVETGEPTRNIVISRWPGYHGATLGALSATGHLARRKPYLPVLKAPAMIHTDYRYRCQCGAGPESCYNDRCSIQRADELEEAILLHGPNNVMAFIGEPIVGAALGAAVPGKNYWQRIREICTKYGVLLIADEVMTGLGRTGANFAMQHFNADPDIIALGKGVAAGYQPLSAILSSAKVSAAFEAGSGVFEHGFTYSGHPTSCAAGLAAVQYVIDNQLVTHVAKREYDFFLRLETLKKWDFVGDVRGKGYLAGIELVKSRDTKEPFPQSFKANAVLSELAREEGLLVYPGSGFIDGSLGDHIMIAPPFVIKEDEMEELFKRLEAALTRFAVLVGDTFPRAELKQTLLSV